MRTSPTDTVGVDKKCKACFIEETVEMADRVGQQLGTYRLIRLLGEGSFAEVYLGEHVHLGTQAAIKVLQTTLLHEDVDHFRTEARTIARLIHPHIVRVLDFGVKRSIPFLVMDYAPHDTLRKLHPEGSRLPPEIVLSYIKQIAAALQYAHQHKVIHRDVKPENMLLGRDHEVLLSDFGLAVVVSSSQHHDLQEVVGTITYTAPEQIEGNPCPASDQYALGVVVYGWLCGAPPFQGFHREVALQHLVAAPPPLREKAPALSPAVEQVVLTALAKDPRRRFASIEAFAAALEQAILSGGTNQEGSSVPAQTSLVGISSHIGRGHQHPLLGRDSEREVLRHFLFETEQCRNAPVDDHATLHLSEHRPSRSTLIVLHGEAGIGKTRLAEEVGRETQRRGWTVLWSQSYAQESPLPYRLWIEVVRQAMTRGAFPYQEMRQHLRLYQPLSTLLPELAEMLLQDAAATAVLADQGQLRLWESVLALLGAISRHTPLLLVLDDLHWADASSQQLLAYLARRLHSYPILLLGTYRESEVLATHPLRMLLTTLQREQVIAMLTVPPLADSHIGTLLSHLPKPLMQRVQLQAAGNPFFAEELARVASAEEHLAQTLPATITAVLDLRLGMLSRACQQLLGKAAVLGNSFSFQQISMLEASNLTSLEEERVLNLLEEALRGSILSEEGTGTHITYTFWHPLLVNHLYEEVSASRRTRLHRRAADVLQRVYEGREEEGAAVITNHLVAGGGEPLQIVHFAELAGDRAYNLSAYPEAEGFYRVTVSQMDEHIGPSLGNSSQEERSRLAYFLERLGECTRVQGNDVEARHLYERVLEVRSYQRTFASDDEFQYEAQIDALLWREIALTWYDLWDSEKAQKCCERGEQVLRDAGVVGGPAWANLRFQQGYIDWREGNYDSAYKFALEALELFKGSFKQQHLLLLLGDALRLTGTKRSLAGDPVNLGRAHTLLAAIDVSIGKPTEALVYLDASLELFEQYDRQREIANVSCNIGDIHLRKAEHQEAEASFRRSLHLADRVGDIPLKAVVFGNLGVLAFRSGSLLESEEWFKKGIILAEQFNDQVYISLFCAYLAMVFHDQGKLNESRESVYRALTIGRGIRNPPCVSLSLVTLGRLRTVQAMEATDKRDNDVSNGTLHQKGWQGSKDTRIRLLRRAKMTLERALALNELEAETRTEGKLALSKALLFLGELDHSQQQAIATLEEAKQCELIWIYTRAQHLIGRILVAQGQQEQAEQYFVQALQVFRDCGARLDYGRTLEDYGLSLLEYDSNEQKNYQRGLSYLLEARQVFDECHAVLELQRVENVISTYRNHKAE